MAEAPVSYERRGRLAVIRLERPDALNALTYPMIAGIEAAARRAEADPEAFALCITGSGRGFCAGIDMSILAESARNRPAAADEARNPALFSFLLSISKPVIAAVNGVAAGGGFVLAMMSDLRFMAQDATMTTVFSRRGLVAEHGTSWLLPRLVGTSRALDLLWSARRVDAQEAYRLGLADRLAPAVELLDAVATYVDEMAATVSPTAVAAIKRQVYAHWELDFDAAAHEAHTLMATALAHPDATEGAVSFVERRPPRFAPWTGERQ